MRASLPCGSPARVGTLPHRPPARYCFASSALSALRRTRRAMQPRCGRSVCCAADATADAPRCALSFAKETPPGDERQRDVCTTCGFVDYKNPKVVVAALIVRGDAVLLCRRAIEPAAGRWGFPQGALFVAKHAAARSLTHSGVALRRRLPGAGRERACGRSARSPGGGRRTCSPWPAAGSLRRARQRAARLLVAHAPLAGPRAATRVVRRLLLSMVRALVAHSLLSLGGLRKRCVFATGTSCLLRMSWRFRRTRGRSSTRATCCAEHRRAVPGATVRSCETATVRTTRLPQPPGLRRSSGRRR
jgi:hypothetical protein